MPTVSLFFRKPQQTQLLRNVGGQIVPMILDATMKESYTTKAEPTQHPVEKGADVTDHVIIRPDSLSLSGIITETPFEGVATLVKAAGATAGSIAGSSLGVFGGAAGAIGGGILGKTLAGSLFGSKDRSLSAIAAEFKKLRDAKQPIDIQTGLQLYKNYVLTSAVVSRDDKSGRSIKVDLEFQEMLFATTKRTNVAIPKLKGAIPGADNGRQSTDTLNDDQNARGSSLLKKLYHGIGG